MDFAEVKKNLEKRGFKVSVFETKEEAADYLDKAVDGRTVGIGGSVTVQQMGLTERLAAHNTVFNHWISVPGKTPDDLRRLAMTTEVYFSSVNGMAQTGEIINIDGSGNRVASTIYGHKKLYYIVGRNKIAPDFEQAMWRARNVAAPLNARRLNCKTPCAVDLKCHDCSSPARICRAVGVIWEPSLGVDTEVILVNEDLGY